VSTPALVLTTFPAETDVEPFARTLVEERLAACVNILPEMRSIYRWAGSVDNAHERQVIIKTSRERVPMLLQRLRALHPYEVPEFIVLPIVDGSDDYLAWIGSSTNS
jgi:periplasmic divalent cation tolerance protein